MFSIISCTEQETVEASKSQQQLNQSSSQIYFILNPNTKISNAATTTIRSMNVVKDDLIRIYTDASCASLIASGTAQSNILDIDITVSLEGDYNFYYKKFNENLDSSDCYNTNIEYTYDNTTPPLPFTITLQDYIGKSATPVVNFYNLEIGSYISVYSDSDCSQLRSESISNSTFTQVTLDIPLQNEGSYTFYYKLRDEAGNYQEVSSDQCLSTSQTYVYDTTMPNLPSAISLQGSSSVDNQSSIDLRFEGLTTGDNIYIYNSSNCSSGYAGDDQITSSSHDINLSSLTNNTTHNFYYILIDQAGNYYYEIENGITSFCIPTGISYHYDQSNPDQLVLTNSTKKEIIGSNGQATQINYENDGELSTLNISIESLELGSTLNIYSQTGCSSSVLHTEQITSQLLQTKIITVSLPTGNTYNLSANQVDEAGNISTCSNDIVYEYYQIEEVLLGDDHSCVQVNNGSEKQAFCWGDNSRGQLALASTESHITLPRQVDTTEDIDSIRIKNNNSCFINSTSNTIRCSGNNQYNQLDSLSMLDSNSLVAFTSQKDVAIGENHLCFINTSNNIECVGKNTHGQLGKGDNLNKSTLTPTATIQSASAISAGFGHTCFIDITDGYNCFGLNEEYQLGVVSNNTNSNTPFAASLESNIASLKLGSNFACYIESTTGQIKCFGSNALNRIPAENYNPEDAVTLIDSTESFTSLSTGPDKACAISTNDELYCWGSSFSAIEKISTDFIPTKVSVGKNHLCILSNTNELYCRGTNNKGQLGIGSTNSSNEFQKVIFDFKYAKIEYSYDTTFEQDEPIYYDFSTNTFGIHQYNITLTNSGNTTATITEIDFNNSQFGYVPTPPATTGNGVYPGYSSTPASSCPASKLLTPGQSCTLNIEFTPTLSAPSGVETILTLKYYDTDSTEIYTDNNTLTGYTFKVLPDVIFKSDSTEFIGVYEYNTTLTPLNVNNNEKLTTTFTIENNGASPVDISSVEIGGDDSNQYSYTGGTYPGTTGTCNNQIASQSSCTILIDYIPNYKSITSHEGILKVLLTSNDKVALTKIPLAGYAEINTPELYGYESETKITSVYNFSNSGTPIDSSIGFRVIKVFEIKNDGNETATITNIAFAGTYASEYNWRGNSFPGSNGTCTQSTVLEVGSSCLLHFEYFPSSASPGTGHEADVQVDFYNTQFPQETKTSIININGYAN